jgi:hypothetical protein
VKRYGDLFPSVHRSWSLRNARLECVYKPKSNSQGNFSHPATHLLDGFSESQLLGLSIDWARAVIAEAALPLSMAAFTVSSEGNELE